MALDNDLNKEGDKEDNDLSSALERETKFLKQHGHKTPPRKAKKILSYAYASTYSKKSSKKGGRLSSESYSSKKYKRQDPEMLLLQEQHNDSMRLKENNLKEMVRHHKAMEASAAWDTRIKELEYKSTLMDKFKSFCQQGYSKKAIARHFPEMKMLCELDEKNMEDKLDE